MPDKIEKGPKINKFINDVITPARNAIQRHQGHHPGSTNTNNYDFHKELVTSGSFSRNPNSFNNVPTVGGRITASDLAIIFQHYAYNLTSIRRATVRRLQNYNGGNRTWSTVWSNLITALDQDRRMDLNTFNSRVRANPNPFNNLQPGDPASTSSIDALINRLASVLSSRRSESAITIRTCHNSCHSNCHGSRGRR